MGSVHSTRVNFVNIHVASDLKGMRDGGGDEGSADIREVMRCKFSGGAHDEDYGKVTHPMSERLVAAAASPLTLTYVLRAFARTRSIRRDKSRRQAVNESDSRSN